MAEHHVLVLIVLGLFSVILADQRCEVVGVPAGVSQVLTVTGNSSVSTSATLSACERSEDGTWLSLPFHFPCVVGYNGIAEPGQKVEGDGKTPSGSFPLGELFGWNATAADPVVQSFHSDYRYIVDAKDVNGYYLDKFVDDSASPYYNTWVSGPTDASSFEEMRISAYKYGLVVNYNMYPTVPGKGSAIFMHIWSGPDSSTAGCIALEESNLIQVLQWLDKSRQPHIIINRPPAQQLY